MKRAWPVYKKELLTYFYSPIAYVVFTIFLLVSGFLFYNIFIFYSQFSMDMMNSPYGASDLNIRDGILMPLFGNMSVIMLLVMPLISMRNFSEEKRSGTFELLATFPIRDYEVVLGKYAAALSIFLMMLGLTLAYPVIVTIFGSPNTGAVISGYLGMALMGGAFLALGIFISAMTENQIVAAVITFGALLFLWIVGWAGESAEPGLSRILSELSILGHFENFSKGVVHIKDIVYYLNFTVFFLFLTLRALESKKWRA